MRFTKSLVIICLSLAWIVPKAAVIATGGEECDGYIIEIKSTGTTDHASNGKIDFSFAKDPEEFSAYLFSGNDNGNQLEVKVKHFDNLEPGTYNLYVKIGKACVKHFTVEIQ
jgi:hypothetical protein